MTDAGNELTELAGTPGRPFASGHFRAGRRDIRQVPPGAPRGGQARNIARTGLNMTEMQMALLEKVEELTLYTLAQQEMIARLQARLEVLTE